MTLSLCSEEYFVKKTKNICIYRKNFVTLCDFWFARLRNTEKQQKTIIKNTNLWQTMKN